MKKILYSIRKNGYMLVGNAIQENLKAAITYFTNNLHLMHYAEHIEKHLPHWVWRN